MSQHVDLAGNEVKEGDLVVYAAAAGRSAVLKYGKVTRLAKRSSYMSSENGKPTVRLRSVDDWYDWKTGKDGWHLQNNGREVTLGFMNRLLVVPRSAVPKEALKLLDGE